jgi:DNA-3-methyladenine glycosylase
MAKLGRGFYHRETRLVASELLGKYLVRQIGSVSLVCCITETEAYIGPIDKACHAFDNRRTPRTEILFGLPGYAYIYMIYGMYHCLNFVTEAEGTPCAVLIRGGTPRGNVDLLARSRFGVSFADLSAYQKKHFLDGPGKLCQALQLTKEENGLDLTGDTLFVCDTLADLGLPEAPEDQLPRTIHTGTRIGIDYAEEAAAFPWRYFL